MAEKLKIVSTNPNDSEADVEIKLEKAVKAVRLKRERNVFKVKALQEKKVQIDKVYERVMKNMINEIIKVL